MRGIFFGSISLIAVYGLLPESLRFSRAVLIFGTFSFTAIVSIGRIIFGGWRLGKKVSNRLVVASEDEAKSIYSLLSSIEPKFKRVNHSD